MKKQISRHDKSTVTIGGKEVDLQLRVDQAVEFNGKTIVVVSHFELPPDDPNFGRNVIAFNGDGSEAWRIKPFWHKVKARDGSMVPDPYDGLRIDKNGKLIAFQGIGYRCELDPKTGEIINAEYTR